MAEAPIPRCNCCHTRDVAILLECHNSACSHYATSQRIYEGWHSKQAAPVAVAGPINELEELNLLNKLVELGAKAAYAHAQSNSDDGHKGTAAYVQWQEMRAEMGELIRAAYAAPTTQPAPAVPAAGVPDGWKLVPVEPTGVMKDCGAGSLPLAAARPWAAGDCYRAMLAAAPQPPTGVAADSAFMERVLGAMEGVIDVADRKTAEFDALRSCIVDLTLMLFSAAPQPQAAQKGGA